MNTIIEEKRKTQRITLVGSLLLPDGYYVIGRQVLKNPREEDVYPVMGTVEGESIFVRVSGHNEDAMYQREFVRRARESGLCVVPDMDIDDLGRQIREYRVMGN